MRYPKATELPVVLVPDRTLADAIFAAYCRAAHMTTAQSTQADLTVRAAPRERERAAALAEGPLMTLTTTVLDLLRERGPLSRTAIEACVAEAGYAPAGVGLALSQLKREGRIRHVRRASRHVTSLYALENDL